MSTFSAFPGTQAGPYPAIAEHVRRLEAMGFHAAYVADQTAMAFPGIIGHDAWSLLAALARDTTRIRIGTLVSPMVLRHPLLLAMAASTVDQASGGRLILGVGAGGMIEDMAGVGLPKMAPADLIARLDEGLDTVDRLLRGETVTREGGYYPTTNAVVERPVQTPRPPIVVAAQMTASIRVAATYGDAWNSLGGQDVTGERVSLDAAVERTRRQVEKLDAACAEIGRDPASIRRSVFAYRANALASDAALAEWIGHYTELGFDEIILFAPRSEPEHAERIAVLERFAADALTT